jgi:hypothetical protein
MSLFLLVWTLFAGVGEYMVAVQPRDIRNVYKRMLWYAVFLPNVAIRATQSQYGKHSYRFSKMMGLTNWLKS